MINKKIIIFATAIIIIISIFFIKNTNKNLKTGNNISNKSADEITKYILNIESYQATANVTIKSNKNENNYLLMQKYTKQNNTYKQEILEPEDISGIQFIYDGETLKIENTKLSLSKIYNDYQYIESNELSLIKFIEDYKQSTKSKCYEENKAVILETENNNKYIANKKLYVNKEQGKIEKMEIKDITQKNKIYILYNEIQINIASKEEKVAF